MNRLHGMNKGSGKDFDCSAFGEVRQRPMAVAARL